MMSGGVNHLHTDWLTHFSGEILTLIFSLPDHNNIIIFWSTAYTAFRYDYYFFLTLHCDNRSQAL